MTPLSSLIQAFLIAAVTKKPAAWGSRAEMWLWLRIKVIQLSWRELAATEGHLRNICLSRNEFIGY